MKNLLFSFLLLAFTLAKASSTPSDSLKLCKMGGVNLVSPTQELPFDYVEQVKRVNASWIAVIPYAFMENNSSVVEYNCEKNWWGDKPDGLRKTIEYAKQHQLKVVLKPHFWIDGKGWAGELKMSDQKWRKWEINYSRFVLEMAKLAELQKLEMLCIGTELKSATVNRSEFWRTLIASVRRVYSGELIYAANWDNYQNIPFWKDLDYIGIDAYFPLSPKQTPAVSELLRAWQPVKYQLNKFSDSLNLQIVFTEMGYRSIHKAAWNQWEIESVSELKDVNLKAQQNGYTALFESFWKEHWFAGGFIWKWEHPDKDAGGEKDSDYTPQNKPVEQIIKKWYEKKCIPPS
jgi:hypothetical protein